MFERVLPSLARSCIAMKLGIAIAARTPMITTTTISSMIVKPRLHDSIAFPLWFPRLTFLVFNEGKPCAGLTATVRNQMARLRHLAAAGSTTHRGPGAPRSSSRPAITTRFARLGLGKETEGLAPTQKAGAHAPAFV